MRLFAVIFICLITLGITVYSSAGEKAPERIVEFAQKQLVKMGSDPVIVKAVRDENAKGKSLDAIKQTDTRWMATSGIDDFMKSLMESECGSHLRKLQRTEPYYAEIFVMDNQGANVCMTDKTSDYWQGDEEKFKLSYKGGTGAVHISDVKFDESSQAYLVQVSVPVKDGNKVIGAITIGVDVDKFR